MQLSAKITFSFYKKLWGLIVNILTMASFLSVLRKGSNASLGGLSGGVFHQLLLVNELASVLWNPHVLRCYTHLGPLKTQSRKWVTEHGFLSLCPPPGVYYASLKKCHRELVGREKCIPNHYCTHLFSGDNLPSSFNKKIEVNGWKILHYLSSQNSPLSWLILMSSVHLREGSKD